MGESKVEFRKRRLGELAEFFGGKTALGRRLGWRDGGYVGQMCAGSRAITEKQIERFESLPGARGWFSREIDDPVILPAGAQAREHSEDVELPQFDAGGSMGRGIVLKDQPGVIQSWRVSSEWIQKNVKSYSAKENLCIVTGFGDSMKPLFNPGDPLLVDIGVRTVDFDAVYFFRVSDEGFIKRLQRIPGEGIRVLSANRDNYEPWTVKEGMDFEVLGRVLKVWCSEDF